MSTFALSRQISISSWPHFCEVEISSFLEIGLNQYDAPLLQKRIGKCHHLCLDRPCLCVFTCISTLPSQEYLFFPRSNSTPQPRIRRTPFLTAKPRLREGNMVPTHSCNSVPQINPTILTEESSNLDYSETMRDEVIYNKCLRTPIR
jgi:hypothetical protein